MKKINSWGNYPKVKNKKINSFNRELSFLDQNYITSGLGRSYGDVGLNENGTLIST